MKKLHIFLLVFVMLGLCGCEKYEQTYFGEIPELVFSKVTENQEGKRCFYLFDDNPEHLNPEFLADGETPSGIAHFGELVPGVYTVFSYHHRGSAAEENEDLFFDVLFRANDAKFKITRIGLDHDWNWNKAWADFSGVDVFAPEVISSFECICSDKACGKPDGKCTDECGCSTLDVLTKADPDRFTGIDEDVLANAGDNLLLSDIIPNIGEERINEIRHGSTNEPVWLMMEFEILSGEMSVDTICYKNKQNCDFDRMKNGRVADEPQYKGIAKNAPVVKTELAYSFDDSTKPGALPIKIFNQKYPEGYIAKDGAFATCVNTWKDTSFISAESAESDMMRLVYKDAEKLKLYGENVTEKTDLWYFDPFHTRLYRDRQDENFAPNIRLNPEEYNGKNENEFYKKYVLNLGNFGVRYIYNFTLKNDAETQKIFVFSMNSVSGQVYRYSFKRDGETIRDDEDRYIVKKYDINPSRKPAKYTTAEEFALAPKSTYTLDFEVVTLTGCDAPMTNKVFVK